MFRGEEPAHEGEGRNSDGQQVQLPVVVEHEQEHDQNLDQDEETLTP